MSDEEHMERFCRTGDPEALAAIVETYQSRLEKFFKKRGKDEETARDLTQDVFMLVIEYKDKYEIGRKLSPWLFAIAVRRMYWSHRIAKHTRVKGCPVILLAGDYSSGSERDEFIDTFAQPAPDIPSIDPEAIQSLLNRLPAHERSLIELMFFQKLPIREAATQLGISKTTAHRQLGDALRRLRDWLRVSDTEAA